MNHSSPCCGSGGFQRLGLPRGGSSRASLRDVLKTYAQDPKGNRAWLILCRSSLWSEIWSPYCEGPYIPLVFTKLEFVLWNYQKKVYRSSICHWPQPMRSVQGKDFAIRGTVKYIQNQTLSCRLPTTLDVPGLTEQLEEDQNPRPRATTIHRFKVTLKCRREAATLGASSLSTQPTMTPSSRTG